MLLFLTEKTSSKSSSFSLEPIAKPKIKWSAADLPEISPVPPFLISEDEREAGVGIIEVTAGEEEEEEEDEVRNSEEEPGVLIDDSQ